MIAIVGATATGKSAVAMRVARAFCDVEIVSLDSMQVYRGLDIGTAKPTAAERAEIRHHLLDIAEPEAEVSVAEVQRLAHAALDDITARGAHALLVGGTGLYVRAVVDGLDLPGQFPETRRAIEAEPDTDALLARLAAIDPDAAAKITPGNRRRVVRALEVTLGSGRPFSSFGPGLAVYPPASTPQVGIDLPIDELDERIAARVQSMLDCGLVAEVESLRHRQLSRTAAVALGYREVAAHLDGRLSRSAAAEAIVTRTRQLARRQRRWFRRDPRIVWFSDAVGAGDMVIALATQRGWRLPNHGA